MVCQVLRQLSLISKLKMFSSIASSQNSSLERLGRNCENIIIARRSQKENDKYITTREEERLTFDATSHCGKVTTNLVLGREVCHHLPGLWWSAPGGFLLTCWGEEEEYDQKHKIFSHCRMWPGEILSKELALRPSLEVDSAVQSQIISTWETLINCFVSEWEKIGECWHQRYGQEPGD